MTSQTLNLFCTFNSHDFTEWETTTQHVINATGYQMALGVRPSLIYVNNIETDDSRKAQENWENQNSQAYGNLMLRISANIRNLATQVGRDTTKDLLDWLKT